MTERFREAQGNDAQGREAQGREAQGRETDRRFSSALAIRAQWGAAVDGVDILFEDQRIIVVDKPPGLLSQPGRQISDSLVERVRAARPQASGPMMMHRLDMDTSGVVVLGKDADAHRELSRQFERRIIFKRYRARLERVPQACGGRIALALRADVENRPMQKVNLVDGRPSLTLWRRIDSDSCEVIFHPLSGRTHQLRVHAADRRGLNNPIVGDRLYGTSSKRLMLHAESIGFRHPSTGLLTICTSPVNFDQSDASGTLQAP